jgi:hypothetical protein
MRKQMIEAYLAQLITSLGKPRSLVEESPLLRLYENKAYTAMILHIKKLFRLECGLKVGYVNNWPFKTEPHIKNAPACIKMPKVMPPYGTKAFKALQITMYIRKSFLERATFYELVIAIAHELSHIVLSAVGHSLRVEEPAVDLTAMLLGFSEFYKKGVGGITYKIEGDPVHIPPFWSSPLGHIIALFKQGDQKVIVTEKQLGYLTPKEVAYAAEKLAYS